MVEEERCRGTEVQRHGGTKARRQRGLSFFVMGTAMFTAFIGAILMVLSYSDPIVIL